MSRIKSCYACTIQDSRGEKTIEVTVEANTGEKGIASVPQGKSTGSREARYVDAEVAVKNVGEVISKALVGQDLDSQSKIDQILIDLDGTPNKSNLGANAILGVSIACAKTASEVKKISLWKYIRSIYGNDVATIPRLYMNMINGGLHAKNSLYFQEYLIIPKTKTIREGVKYGIDFYQKLKELLEKETGIKNIKTGDEGGFAPDINDNLLPFEYFSKVSKTLSGNFVDFGLDAAASNVKKDSNEIWKIYMEMKKKFNIFYLEDPFGENDIFDFKKITQKLGSNTIITGDDLTTTNPKRIEEMAREKIANGVIIKPNQIGTLSEALEAVRVARKNNWNVIVSHRSGETEDSFIADFAWAVGADGIKLGAPLQKERMAKFNRLLVIEQEG